jgi:hypothetical protein
MCFGVRDLTFPLQLDPLVVDISLLELEIIEIAMD